MAFDPNLTDWRVAIFDGITDTPIALVDQYAFNKQFNFRLNRPSMMTFRVPSDEPLINLPHTDFFGNVAPYLSCGDRYVKCWRKESGTWVQRFGGIVWQLQDEADGDICYTSVTVFDPLQLLMHRIIRDAVGDILKNKAVEFTDQSMSDIIKAMIDRTHAYSWSSIDTSAGSFPATGLYTAEYQQDYVGRAIAEICDTGVLDLDISWLNDGSGNVISLDTTPRLGSDKPNVEFAYDIGNYGAQTWNRMLDMEQMANSITNLSEDKKLSSFQEDAASVQRYTAFEVIEPLTGIKHQSFLTDLTTQELAERKDPHEIVTFTPRPELQPVVFNDFYLGDTVRVFSSVNVREAVAGIQRVYGIVLDVDDDGYEKITELTVSPNQDA